MVSIIRRSEWTDTNVRFVSRLRAQGLVIHHSATSNTKALSGDDECKRLIQVVRSIYLHHTGSNGWVDIGYHFVIGRGGLIVEARSMSAQTLKDGLMVPGAHCPTKNTTHIGICLEGNYMNEDVPSNMWESLVKLMAALSLASGFALNRQTVLLHREVRQTSCPGDVVTAKIDAILEHANRVKSRQQGVK